jgi:type VI secretion system secreted protein VgrG
MKTKQRLCVWIEAAGARWEHVRVRKLSGREAIGQLFRFDLEGAADPEHEIPDTAKPGEEVSIVFELDGNEVRRVHGVIDAARRHLGGPGDRATIDLRVVPRVARLGLVETQEIFVGKSVPEIIRTKLERHGFVGEGDLDLRLLGAYAAREFVMQYGETDLAFISRLAENLGISFFFEHGDDHDRIVFTDHEHGFTPPPPVNGAIAHTPRGERDGVYDLDLCERVAPTSHIVHDYNYRSPLVDLTAASDLQSGNGGGVVEYGCNVKTPADADALALARAEEQRSRQTVYEGKSGVLGFTSGARVSVTDVPGVDGEASWLLVDVTHEATMPLLDEQESAEARYHGTFRAVPGGFTYRPPRVTPRPHIGGVVTGVIQVGQNGEIDGIAPVDAEGRYSVTLHLDTSELGAQKTSHPIRMAQPFAGPSYGMHFPLRRGTEVMVVFANGDPDRPIIAGALYNAAVPNPVVANNAASHRIRSISGALFEIYNER